VSQHQENPFARRSDAPRNLLPYPALTLMVLLRGDVGYRMLKTSWFWGNFLVEMGYALFCQAWTDPAAPGIKFSPLMKFAVLSFAVGIYQKIKRWREFNRGVRQHSFYLGTSRFRSLPLPAFIQRRRRVERFVDPIFCFLVGTLLLPFTQQLSLWLLLSSGGLKVIEDAVYQKELHREFDVLDGMIGADIQHDVVDRFDKPPGASDEGGPGVPTGISDDIHQQIKRRRAKQSPPQKGA
jgi:hypothetical protein